MHLSEKEHVVLGGGQEAMSVTTTHGKAGKFDARFFHMVSMPYDRLVYLT
jgi:translation initiation factor 3 subunit I